MAEDFFGDLSKSLSSAAQQAVDKTSTFFESQKMGVQIQTAQREIDRLYLKIGAAVAKEAKEEGFAVSEAVQALLDEVGAQEDKIAGLKKGIARIRGQKICPECGSTIDAEHAYCPKCGAAVPVEEPEPDPVEEEVCECEVAEEACDAAEEACECACDAAEEMSEEVSRAVEEAKEAVAAECEAAKEACECASEAAEEAAEAVEEAKE